MPIKIQKNLDPVKTKKVTENPRQLPEQKVKKLPIPFPAKSGLFDVIGEPITLFKHANDLKTAYEKKEFVNKIKEFVDPEISLPLAKTPFSMLHSIGDIYAKFELFFGKIGKLVKVSKTVTKYASNTTSFLALIISSIDFIIQLFKIEHVIEFSEDPLFSILDNIDTGKTDKEKSAFLKEVFQYLRKNKKELMQRLGECIYLKKLEEVQDILKNTEKINTIDINIFKARICSYHLLNFSKKYLENDDNQTQEQKIKKLEKIIRPFAVQKIQTSLENSIIKKLQSNDSETRKAAIQEAEKLTQTIQTQHQKILRIHTIAIVAITIMILGSTLSLLIVLTYTSPPIIVVAIPIVIFGIGFSIEFANYYYAAGILDHEGWNYNFKQGIVEAGIIDPAKNLYKKTKLAAVWASRILIIYPTKAFIIAPSKLVHTIALRSLKKSNEWIEYLKSKNRKIVFTRHAHCPYLLMSF